MATRAIHKVVYELGLGIDGQPMVYLSLTRIDRATLHRKLGGVLEIYEKFVGVDPCVEPMKIFPGMHYTMGGIWVDFNQMTNVPGIFAAGEVRVSVPRRQPPGRELAGQLHPTGDSSPDPTPWSTPKTSPRRKVMFMWRRLSFITYC